MEYKMIFLDVDGTLYSHTTKSIPESTIRALKIAQNKGIKICIASGRSKLVTNYTGILDLIDFDYYVVTNGNLVLDKYNNIIYSSPMDKDGIKEVLSIVDKYHLNLTFMTKDDFYLYNDIDKRAHLGFDPLSIPLPNKKEYKEEDVYQINLFCEDELFYLFEDTKKKLAYSRIFNYNYDIFTLNHNKAIGIQKLLEHLNINKEEVIAFGDGHNDAEMIEYVGLGIAMGNAIDKVKNVSDYITDHIDNNGIYNALIKYRIISD